MALKFEGGPRCEVSFRNCLEKEQSGNIFAVGAADIIFGLLDTPSPHSSLLLQLLKICLYCSIYMKKREESIA